MYTCGTVLGALAVRCGQMHKTNQLLVCIRSGRLITVSCIHYWSAVSAVPLLVFFMQWLQRLQQDRSRYTEACCESQKKLACELDSWYTVQLDSRYIVQLDSRYIVQLDSRYTVQLDSRYTVQLDSWYTVQLDSWHTVQLDSWHTVQLDSWHTVQLDSWHTVQLDWVTHSEKAQIVLVGKCSEDWPLGKLRLWDSNVRMGLKVHSQ